MTNIFDYLKWRGDLTFDQDPFNKIDSLVLSRLVYLRWEYILSSEEKMTIKEAYDKFSLMNYDTIHMLADEDPELFKQAAASQRFKTCIVGDFINEINDENVIQFCAMTIHLPDGTHAIVFRGTDNTLIGWKEDLYMSVQPNVSSQKQAKLYLKAMAQKYRGKIRVIGHSKGGNLAIYSSVFSSKLIQRRILHVDNFDGPGLSLENFTNKRELNIYQRIHTYCPQNSIIGRMLYHENSQIQLLYSSGRGPWQHDLYKWSIIGKEFQMVSQFKKESEIIENTFKEFLEKVSPNQRKRCIDIIFEILESTNEDTFHDFSSNWFKNSKQVVKYISQIEPCNRKIVIETMKIILSIVFDEFKTTFSINGKE